MNINPEHRKILVDEFRYAAKMMREVKFVEQKLFNLFQTIEKLNPSSYITHLFHSKKYDNLTLIHIRWFY